MRRLLISGLAAALCVLSSAQASERIVGGSGTVTEILCALGAGDSLVAVDTSSLFPGQVQSLPKVGYSRQLSAEGILSVSPTLLVVSSDAGPPAVLEQVRKAGVEVLVVSNEHTPEAAKQRILEVGKAIGKGEAAAELAGEMDAQLEQARKMEATGPSVLFLYARGGGVLNVSGTHTAADAMITLAGAINAVQGYEGYKPLTSEAAVQAAPEVILMTTHGLEAAGGVEAVLAHPGLALTPAGRSGRVVVMDDLLLLGFGPRLGEAVGDLAKKLRQNPVAKAAP